MCFVKRVKGHIVGRRRTQMVKPSKWIWGLFHSSAGKGRNEWLGSSKFVAAPVILAP